MKHKITVFTLASDTDYGTQANVFATKREAYLALIDHPSLKLEPEEKAELLRALEGDYAERDDEETDFYAILDRFKSAMDTFSVDKHTLEIEISS
jgi:hypothetical protein